MCQVAENELLNWCLVKCFPYAMDTIVLEYLGIAEDFNAFLVIFFHFILPEYTRKPSFLLSSRDIEWEHSHHKKCSFSLRISSVNLSKSAISCRFGYIY